MSNEPVPQNHLFESIEVRSVWDDEQEKWWVSVLDVISVLTEHADYTKTRKY